MAFLNSRLGKVASIKRPGADVQEVAVEVEGIESRAVNYTALTGEVSPGDEVLLNTTAVDLSLGTGGVHFIMCNLSNPAHKSQPRPGHIMKLRYTPLQSAVLAVEEDDSPDQDAIREFAGLQGMPVVCCELHSQIAPAAAAVKALSGEKVRVAYIMTDGAALPLGFSRLVAELKAKDLIDVTLTCGQAFGGDIETVNIYTALIAAREVAHADVAIVSQGPGNAGAGSKFGFSGIQQGEALNAVSILGGNPIAAVRMSFADRRERHRGVSHHALTILEDIAVKPVAVAVPELPEQQACGIEKQLEDVRNKSLHSIYVRSGEVGLTELSRLGIRVKTMGRAVEEDREFFLAASAAGTLAAEFLSARD